MGQAMFQQMVTEFNLGADGDYSGSIERLEKLILDHAPTSASEAVSMLDLIIPEVEAGGRSDGRDVRALVSIRTYLGTVPG